MTDSSPEAAATTPRDTTFDRRMIDDLRRYRRAVPSDVVPVTLDELDALLAAADERDAYEREACAEPAPREAEERARCRHCGGRIAVRKSGEGKNWRHLGGDPARGPIGYHPAEPTPALAPSPYECERHPACRWTGWPPYFQHSVGCANANAARGATS